MKKYLFIIGLGVMFANTSCDPQNEEGLFADVDQAVAASVNEAGDPNARKVGKGSGADTKLAYDYEVAESAYYQLIKTIPPIDGESSMKESRSREDFLEKMIIKSLGVFDKSVMTAGHKMSDLAKRNHAALAGDEHEIEYDVAQAPQAAATGYLKIGDIKGESTDHEYPVAKIFQIRGSANSAKGNPWNDSIPPVKAPEAVGLGDFVLELSLRTSDPTSLDEALGQLEISSGINPTQVGLLLPAIQKVREAASHQNARGKADILIETLHVYGLDKEDDLSTMYKVGGMGAIGKLVSDNYDESGDVDWASIQLNRKKFELEMLFLWSRFWDNHQTDPTTGR